MHSNRWARSIAGVAVISLIVMGCARSSGTTPAPATTCKGSGDKGSVQLMINEWVGAAANVAVAECLLKQMGYSVKTNTLAEEVAWQGFATGEVDVILENWGHPELEQKYIKDEKLAVDAGSNGVTGIIGWYVPPWMVEKYPDITDWNNLNKYADLFKTSESGDKGQFLGANPTFVQYDEALIANLKLNYKVVFSGSEAASITAFRAAEKNKTPLIGYFYDPQWLLNEIKLVQVKLPAYTPGCDKDLKKVACDYPPYVLNKIVRTAWQASAGDAATFINKFSWKNSDQNEVSDLITNSGGTPEDAARKWIDAHPDSWKAWMP